MSPYRHPDPAVRKEEGEVLAAIAWLERGYSDPGVFSPPSTGVPRGLFQVKPDHDCVCGNPRYAALWTHSDAAAKWKAGGAS